MTWVVGAAYVTGVGLVILLLSLAVMASLWVFLTHTWTGKALRAMSQDLDATRQMGVSTDRLRQFAFGLGAALAAVAGVMVAMYYQNVYPQMGVPFGLKGFTAALLGGLASIPGAVSLGLLLGISRPWPSAMLAKASGTWSPSACCSPSSSCARRASSATSVSMPSAAPAEPRA